MCGCFNNRLELVSVLGPHGSHFKGGSLRTFSKGRFQLGVLSGDGVPGEVVLLPVTC